MNILFEDLEVKKKSFNTDYVVMKHHDILRAIKVREK